MEAALGTLIHDARLIPFVIATTGHRSIAPEAEGLVEAGVRNVLLQFINERGLIQTPLVLLSALAEGSDQMVARCALDLQIAVFAVLPLPLEEYSQTMAPAAAEQMQSLLRQCEAVVQLPAEGLDHALPDDARQADAYHRLGHFLAENCQMLLALWDGAPPEKTGGTAEVVQGFLSGWVTSEPKRRFHDSQTGVVYHVVTPRAGEAPRNAGNVHPLIGKLDEAREERSTKPLWRNTDSDFNGLLQRLENYNQRASAVPEGSLDSSLLQGLPNSEATPFLQRIAAVSTCADQISRAAADRRRLFLRGILLAGATATLGYAIVDEVFHEMVLLWLVLPCLLLLALLLHRFAARERVEDLYLDCRALSEGLRVQFFWELGAVDLAAADFYLPHESLEIDWIRSALRTICLFREGAPTRTCSKKAEEFVLRRWIENQATWFRSRSSEQEGYVARRDRASRAALLLAIGYSVLVPLLLGLPVSVEWAHRVQTVLNSRPWYDLLHLPAVVATVWAGAVRIWTDQLGFVEQAREYRRIAGYFGRQARRIAKEDLNSAELKELLQATGKQALEENGRWLTLHREKPLEVDPG